MNGSEFDISDIAHIIQISIAPVFMLAGIAGFLNVLAGRLARVINRAREVDESLDQVADEALRQDQIEELKVQLKRGGFINSAIIFCTCSAFLICLVIIVIFLGSFVSAHFALVVSGLFIICMVCLSIAFALFLLEVSIATHYTQTSSREKINRRILLPKDIT